MWLLVLNEQLNINDMWLGLALIMYTKNTCVQKVYVGLCVKISI